MGIHSGRRATGPCWCLPKLARSAHPLTDKTIRDAVRGVGTRAFPLYDGHGLHLINRDGRYHWRLKYRRPDGRENRLALGPYPEVRLAEARTLALDARAKLRAGIDPGGERKAAKGAARAADGRAFEKVARAWLAVKRGKKDKNGEQISGWAAVTDRKNTRAVEHYLLPKLGNRDVGTITTADVLPVIREANTHSPEFARTAAGAAQSIIRLAIAEGHREEGRLLDLDLRHNLPGRERGHMPAATTPAGVRDVMKVIRGVQSPITRAALLVACYTAPRPCNVVGMRWDQLDMKVMEWILPAKVMKMREDHIVPLPLQAIALIESLRPLTGGHGYVFPPVAQQKTPHLHRDTLSKALRDAGLRGKQTPHGLRATFRTMARERLGVNPDVLEAQLAHAKRGEVQAAYDRTGLLEERHRVMQAWADYLDGLK